MNGNGSSEEREDILVMVDEEGIEHDFALIDRFTVERYDYAILVPVIYIEEEADDEVEYGEDAYIFRIEESDEGDSLVEVDDEDEWHKVASAWELRTENLRNSDDEE
ncbi:MAG: DUF1292 domain-containing protein [Bacillota bacterium]